MQYEMFMSRAQKGLNLEEGMFPQTVKTEMIPFEEYYNRVAARAELGRSHPVDSAKAVIKVLKQALSEGEFEGMADEPPLVYVPLLGQVGTSPVSAS